MKRQVEQDKNQRQRQGNDNEQALIGFLHFLELAAPFGAIRSLEQIGGLGLGLSNGATEISAAHAELHRDQPVALLAVDRRGARADKRSLGIGHALLVEGRYQVAEA